MPLRRAVATCLILTTATVATACTGGPATDAAGALSDAHRAALADSIRALSDSIIAAGARLDAAAMTAPFLDGPAAAFGSAGGLVLGTAQLRSNITTAYRSLRGQRFETMEQRVGVLGPDAAVTTGWGNFTSTDTTGTEAQGLQAFTFVWVRQEGTWRVLQAHFSSQLTGMQRPERSATPPQGR